MIQFKYPEVLWTLVLLLIPLLIHLFHLRRFKKTQFTNVALLKSIKLTTRKSSQLKKWLVLLTRFGLLLFLIVAFAQPFIPNTENFGKPSELVIYLDNSFSMQARGSNGSLLNEGKQQLLKYLPTEGKFTFYTNDKSFVNVTKDQLLNALIELDFSSNILSFNAAYLKGVNFFKEKESLKNLVFISDFQAYDALNKDSLVVFHGIQLQPQNPNNIAIDSDSTQIIPIEKRLVLNFQTLDHPLKMLPFLYLKITNLSQRPLRQLMVKQLYSSQWLRTLIFVEN